MAHDSTLELEKRPAQMPACPAAGLELQAAMPLPAEISGKSNTGDKSLLFDLSTQIAQHKQQETTRSCLDQITGVIYHPDADSLAALQKLYDEVNAVQHCTQHYQHGKPLQQSGRAPAAVDRHLLPQIDHQLVDLAITSDRQALAQREQVDGTLSDIARGTVFLLKGRLGLAITLGTYALSRARPQSDASNFALGAGAGVIEGGAYHAGGQLFEEAVHHGGILLTRYLTGVFSPQLHAAGSACLNVLGHSFSALGKTAEQFCIDALKGFQYPMLSVLAGAKKATAQEAFDAVSTLMAHTSPAAADGPLIFAEHNVQLGNLDKARLYHRAYEHMFSRAHLIFLEEVDPGFCGATAGSINYKGYASRVNSRGQGLGFLLHPRLELIGEPVSLEPIAQVRHIPDLRPGFMLHLKDTHSGAQFDAVAVHLKSMLGGGYTHGVRYTQTNWLTHLISDAPTIAGGDWNFFLNKHESEMLPLKQAGFRLLSPTSDVPTQNWGGRIDGFMTHNVPWEFGNCRTFNFWQRLRHHSFSDHGLLRIGMDVSSGGN